MLGKIQFKNRLPVAALLAFATFGNVANAAEVRVFGEKFSLSVINNFYDSLAGHNSEVITDLTAANLLGVRLLWAVQPADAYTAAELDVMGDFLALGGRIAFMGEHGTHSPNENNRISAALTSLGSTISINNILVDPGFRDATRVGGQILTHDLTEGVNRYNYAAFAPLNISGTAEALMLGSDLTSIMMAYQNIGPGSVFLITDQNVWDNVSNISFDNDVMFENLLEGDTGAPPPPGIPEPSSYALMGTGIVGLIALARKRAQQ